MLPCMCCHRLRLGARPFLRPGLDAHLPVVLHNALVGPSLYSAMFVFGPTNAALTFAALALLQFAAITLYMPFMLLQPLCLHVCSVCRLQRLRSVHVYNAYKNA